MKDKRIKSTVKGAADKPVSKPNNDKFRENFDRIFGKPKDKDKDGTPGA